MDYVLQTAESCFALDLADTAPHCSLWTTGTLHPSLVWRWRISKTGRKATENNLPVVLDDRLNTSRGELPQANEVYN